MGETDTSQASTLNNHEEFPDAHGIGGKKEAPLKDTNDRVQVERLDQAVAAQEYPHGI